MRRYDPRNQFECRLDVWSGCFLVALVAIPILWCLKHTVGIGGHALELAGGAAVLYGGTVILTLVVAGLAEAALCISRRGARHQSNGDAQSAPWVRAGLGRSTLAPSKPRLARNGRRPIRSRRKRPAGGNGALP